MEKNITVPNLTCEDLRYDSFELSKLLELVKQYDTYYVKYAFQPLGHEDQCPMFKVSKKQLTQEVRNASNYVKTYKIHTSLNDYIDQLIEAYGRLMLGIELGDNYYTRAQIDLATKAVTGCEKSYDSIYDLVVTKLALEVQISHSLYIDDMICYPNKKPGNYWGNTTWIKDKRRHDELWEIYDQKERELSEAYSNLDMETLDKAVSEEIRSLMLVDDRIKA